MPNDVQLNSNSLKNFLANFLEDGFIFAVGPSDLAIGWGEWQRSAHAHPERTSIYVPDFYLEDPLPWRVPQNSMIIPRATDVFAKLRAEVNFQSPAENQRFQWVEPTFEGFEQQVRQIRADFENLGLQKAVPVVHAQAREIMTQDRLLAIIEGLAKVPASLIPHGFWEKGEGLLGATPERLFTLSETGLKTMALAGTRAKLSKDDGASLMNDSKERHEHQLVIDDIKTQLSQFGQVTVGETFAAELPTLFHLKTQIELEGDIDFATAARILHPTPALGLSPRSLGLETIRRWDDVTKRKRFGAPFGISVPGRIQDCLVAIRNVQWSAGQAPTLGSGCGFVHQSETALEWDELRVKRDSVKKVMHV